MRIVISPAKKMKENTDHMSCSGLPQFLPEAQVILRQLQGMSDIQRKALWGCSDTIAKLNNKRLYEMNLQEHLTPAVLAYEGIQYQYMAPSIFEDRQFSYINEHLRILSGFYGLLCPFDGVSPYRLEMQAHLSVNGSKNLYDFWSNKIAGQLCAETDFILNLASKEYSKVVKAYLSQNIRFLTCTFGEQQPGKSGKIIEKGTLCKMARGEMVRWLADNYIIDEEGIKDFDQLGYKYDRKYSTEDHFVFIKKEN